MMSTLKPPHFTKKPPLTRHLALAIHQGTEWARGWAANQLVLPVSWPAVNNTVVPTYKVNPLGLSSIFVPARLYSGHDATSMHHATSDSSIVRGFQAIYEEELNEHKLTHIRYVPLPTCLEITLHRSRQSVPQARNFCRKCTVIRVRRARRTFATCTHYFYKIYRHSCELGRTERWRSLTTQLYKNSCHVGFKSTANVQSFRVNVSGPSTVLEWIQCRWAWPSFTTRYGRGYFHFGIVGRKYSLG